MGQFVLRFRARRDKAAAPVSADKASVPCQKAPSAKVDAPARKPVAKRKAAQ